MGSQSSMVVYSEINMLHKEKFSSSTRLFQMSE